MYKGAIWGKQIGNSGLEAWTSFAFSENPMPASEKPVPTPNDAELFRDERGLFFPDPATDRRGSTRMTAQAQTAARKNVDFLRLKDMALHLLDPRRGLKMLDLGCARGAEMVYCGLQGAEVYGQDLDPASVALANRKMAHLKLNGEARVGDARTLAWSDGFFDAVLSSDFHEHLDAGSQLDVLRECRRVLKPAGVLVIKTPNLRYLQTSVLFKRLRALGRLKSPFGYVIPHTPGTADPQHIGLIAHATLGSQLEEAGFLNWRFYHAPLRRLGASRVMEIASTEVPGLRDILCEDLFCKAFNPIALSHFPD